ncbi:hypothetical protein [Geodermatophilus africanus]|uniref:hypothetical protein n=1 Tax=Geodermatophilus africanus TaxID=1137993 RepID=UPI00111491A3|nr:hypothetical protein [Geodermatophilus africanus]
MEIDLSRVPRGELAARALVEAVAQADDRVERHCLEVKSSIDLKSKDGISKVAKFILGAANRMPDVAARYFGGHAVMVLGVAPGSTPGFEAVKALDIESCRETAAGGVRQSLTLRIKYPRTVALTCVLPACGRGVVARYMPVPSPGCD